MEYISSDTNVWLDFEVINRLSLPFQLPYTYLMNQDVIEDELLSPPILTEIVLLDHFFGGGFYYVLSTVRIWWV